MPMTSEQRKAIEDSINYVKGAMPRTSTIVARSVKSTMPIAKKYWLHSYGRGARTDREAFEMLYEGAPTEAGRAYLTIPTQQLSIMWLARWCHEGFPAVTITPKLAALWCMTTIGKEAAAAVAVPWHAFAIHVPPGLLYVAGTGDGKPEEVAFLGFEATEKFEKFALIAYGAEGTIASQYGMKLEDLAEEMTDLPNQLPSEWEVNDSDRRMFILAGRLAIAVLIELDVKHVAAVRAGPPKKKPKHGRIGEPVAWTFVMTRDIAMDCRCLVADITNGQGESNRKRSVPTVQTLVRGHHKMQPCGPGRAERKWILVEPYWRGPEDAPIAVRAHKLPDDH